MTFTEYWNKNGAKLKESGCSELAAYAVWCAACDSMADGLRKKFNI